MEIKVQKNLNLEIIPKPKKHSSNNKQFYLVGNLLGAYHNNKIFNKAPALNYLKAWIGKNLEEIIDFVRKSVGNFYLIIKDKDKIQIICSPSSPGFFYIISKEKLIISNKERYVYKRSSLKNLDEMEILNLIISIEALRSPFTSIFKDVKRVIGGQALIIKPNLKTKTNLYIKKDPDKLTSLENCNEKERYQLFKKTLETTVKIIIDNTKNPYKYLMLSGGIDSTVLLIALLKSKTNFQPLHWFWEPDQQKVALAICKMLKTNLRSYSPKDSVKENISKIKSIYETGLGILANDFILNQGYYFAKNNIKSPLTFTAQSMDSIYAIDPLLARFEITGLPLFLYNLRTFPYRFLYTRNFLRHLGKSRLYDYLVSMAVPPIETAVPLTSFQCLPDSLTALTSDYQKFRKNLILSPIINLESCKKNTKLPVSYINHLIRILKWVKYDQGGRLNYLNYNEIGGYELVDPFIEGSFSNFLNTFQLTFKDALFPKRFCYKYFKQETGISYKKLVKRALNKGTRSYLKNLLQMSVPGFAKKMYRIIKPRDNKQTKGMEKTIKIFQKLINSKNSLILPQIKNELIKNYLLSMYERIHSQPCSLSGEEFGNVERLANLEILLKSLFNQSS